MNTKNNDDRLTKNAKPIEKWVPIELMFQPNDHEKKLHHLGE